MLERFRQRSQKLEHLDTGEYTPEEYENCLAELRVVNRWLGDARALRRSVLTQIKRDGLKDFSMLDVGAGSGELLRVVAECVCEENRSVRLIGLDYGERAVETILEESQAFDEIASVRGDALRLPFTDDAFDYVICSLFTHHLRDEQIIVALCEMSRVARRRVFVIDLHRHAVAYFFYTTVGRLFLHNRLIREDGALSILRGFLPHELRGLAERAGLMNAVVHRRFPYRLVLSAGKG